VRKDIYFRGTTPGDKVSTLLHASRFAVFIKDKAKNKQPQGRFRNCEGPCGNSLPRFRDWKLHWAHSLGQEHDLTVLFVKPFRFRKLRDPKQSTTFKLTTQYRAMKA